MERPLREYSIPALAEIPPSASAADVVTRRAAEQPHAVMLRRKTADGDWADVTASQFRDEVQALAEIANLRLDRGDLLAAQNGFTQALARARELGADEVINHSTEKIATEVKRLTGRRGVDVVFEHVGEATWNESIRSLAPGGRLVTCGATTGYNGAIDIRYLFTRQISLLGSFMGSKSDLLAAVEFLKRGLLKPVIDIVLPLEKCAEAHRRLENSEQFGKIVLKVA